MRRASVRVLGDDVRGSISPLIYGQFIEHMGRCIYGGIYEPDSSLADERGFRRDVLDTMQALRIPILRYPGGCFSDEYHWRDGVGPREQRPHYEEQFWTRMLNGVNRQDLAGIVGPPESNAFGTDEFLTLCAELGSRPYLNVNHGTGTPEEAAEWLVYCNRRPESPAQVKVVGVGNEVFGFWETGHCGGEEYGRHFLEFAEALRGIDPDVKLLATGAPRAYGSFTSDLLRTAGKAIDYVSVHAFHPPLPGMRALRDDEPDYWSVVAGPEAMIRNVDDVIADIERELGPDSPVRIAFDEWNLWSSWEDCVATNYDLRAGLMFAGTFHRIHERVPRLEMAMIAQLVNMLGLIQTDGDRLFESAGYLVSRLYAEETLPLALKCLVEGETFDAPVWADVPERFQPMMGEELTGLPYVDVSVTASDDRKRLAVFLVNRHLDQPVTIDLTFDGWQPPASGKLRQMAADSPFARNDFDNPQRLRIVDLEVPSLDRLELPPHSVSALLLG